jgi:hypothetical protein
MFGGAADGEEDDGGGKKKKGKKKSSKNSPKARRARARAGGQPGGVASVQDSHALPSEGADSREEFVWIRQFIESALEAKDSYE